MGHKVPTFTGKGYSLGDEQSLQQTNCMPLCRSKYINHTVTFNLIPIWVNFILYIND